MPGLVRVGGAWKTVSGISVRVGGAWKTVNDAFVRVAGVWKSWGSSTKNVAIALGSPQWIEAYSFLNGWGAKFAAPTTLPDSGGTSVAFNPAKNALAFASVGAPHVHAWAWSASGFGSKFAAPGAVTGDNIIDVTWSPNGNTILASGNSDLKNVSLSAYSWSNGFGTRYAYPQQPLGVSGAVGWAPGSNYVVVPGSSVPWVDAYGFSPSGWGTKLATPNSFSFTTYSMQFNAAGNIIFSAGSSSPYIFAHAWSAGWGSKYANPATLPSNFVDSLAFSPAGNSVIISVAGNNIQGWSWSNGWGAKYADPITPTRGSVAFTSDGSAALAALNGSPFLFAWPWLPGFGTQYANPATLPSGAPFTNVYRGRQVAST
jgi:hypothetical protein